MREDGALSACARLWQFPAGSASPATMQRAFLFATAVLASALAGPAFGASDPRPVPGGLIGTLEQGRYTCELPGDAGGPVRVSAREFDFTVIHGSNYRAGGQRGSYLLTGDIVQMTGGTLKGLKLHRISTGFLRRVDNGGRDGEMRCVLGTPGNS